MSSYHPMHDSFHFINQILQLAYTTQACILNLKPYAMQASTWLCIYQMQPVKVYELAPLLVCFSCPRILILSHSSILLPLCPCPCPTSTSLSQSLTKLSYLCIISPPLSSISIKGVLLIDAKVCIWGRWLRLEYFLWTSLDYWNDTTCRYHL